MTSPDSIATPAPTEPSDSVQVPAPVLSAQDLADSADADADEAEPVEESAPQHTKCTPEKIEEICKLIRAGSSFREPAAAACGIPISMFKSWLRRGQAGRDEGRNNRFVKFLDAIEKAEAEAECRGAARLTTAATEDWHAAAHILERRFRKNWGAEIRVQIETTIDHVLDVADRVRQKYPGDWYAELLTELSNFEPGE